MYVYIYNYVYRFLQNSMQRYSFLKYEQNNSSKIGLFNGVIVRNRDDVQQRNANNRIFAPSEKQSSLNDILWIG